MADVIRESLLLVGVDNSKYEEVKAFVDLIFAKTPNVPTKEEIKQVIENVRNSNSTN